VLDLNLPPGAGAEEQRSAYVAHRRRRWCRGDRCPERSAPDRLPGAAIERSTPTRTRRAPSLLRRWASSTSSTSPHAEKL
jgi:hypothetical protein